MRPPARTRASGTSRTRYLLAESYQGSNLDASKIIIAADARRYDGLPSLLARLVLDHVEVSRVDWRLA
jgi:hypothetical protein